jgi:hypothetical protein
MPRPEQPFRFLDSYEVEDADTFFGRERETRILLADILVSRLVVLFARTGTGKTSLINAGVRLRLEKQGYATFLVRVNEDPLESARAELRQFGELKGQNLSQQLEAVAAKLKRPSVIIFDQFEEFFIYMYKKDRAKGREFIADIGRLYHNRNSRVHVLFSMREEFFVDMLGAFGRAGVRREPQADAVSVTERAFLPLTLIVLRQGINQPIGEIFPKGAYSLRNVVKLIGCNA